ncbi:hypothetical protein [Natroniella sp. ANB-PHB2]|uniref:hypothetical protein n=1 Tax=Natroniella sp. ANB-PHB2 TaxID=3384444 RepID=UPI0038D3A705
MANIVDNVLEVVGELERANPIAIKISMSPFTKEMLKTGIIELDSDRMDVKQLRGLEIYNKELPGGLAEVEYSDGRTELIEIF